MRKRIFHILKVVFYIAVLFFTFYPDTLFVLRRELILFQEMPIVAIASKKLQKAAESPIPVIVIDEEEIKLSGASNIPEVLRRHADIDMLSVDFMDMRYTTVNANIGDTAKMDLFFL